MATIFPFTKDIEGLVETMDSIPIDDGVKFAEDFKRVLDAHNGNPWGPQATPASKLATRLHFAGWTRKELEEAGLKPKDVENFRRRHDMKAAGAGRPEGRQNPLKGLQATTTTLDSLIPNRLTQLKEDKKKLEARLAEVEAEMRAIQVALATVDQMIEVAQK